MSCSNSIGGLARQWAVANSGKLAVTGAPLIFLTEGYVTKQKINAIICSDSTLNNYPILERHGGYSKKWSCLGAEVLVFKTERASRFRSSPTSENLNHEPHMWDIRSKVFIPASPQRNSWNKNKKNNCIGRESNPGLADCCISCTRGVFETWQRLILPLNHRCAILYWLDGRD